jgi:hypothetical protein
VKRIAGVEIKIMEMPSRNAKLDVIPGPRMRFDIAARHRPIRVVVQCFDN